MLLYTGNLRLFDTDSYILVRDRSPAVSDSESDVELDKSSDSDRLGRIIVPPHVNCVVKDSYVRGHLPTILNAKVCKRLYIIISITFLA